MILDYHMHLRDPDERIVHTLEAVERFVETASARGVDEIGFTEHVYYFRQTRPVWTLQYQIERCVYDLDAYVDVVLEAKRRGLPVKLGLEVDYVGERQDELAPLLEAYPWDYLLGSVHWIDGQAVDQQPGIWAHAAVDEVWRRYFAALVELASSGHVDVLAHPDLAKIFGDRPDADRVSAPRRRRPRDLDRRAAQAGRGAVPGGGDARIETCRSRLPRMRTCRPTSAVTSTARSRTRVRQATRP